MGWRRVRRMRPDRGRAHSGPRGGTAGSPGAVSLRIRTAFRPLPVSTASPVARALLGAALAILAGLGASLLLARFGRDRLMRWPAAVLIALTIVVAVAFGVRGGLR